MDALERNRRRAKERIASLNLEMAKAPSWKRGTTWWQDREREIEACQRRIRMCEIGQRRKQELVPISKPPLSPHWKFLGRRLRLMFWSDGFRGTYAQNDDTGQWFRVENIRED